MAYTQDFVRARPGCFLFVVDQTAANWRGIAGTARPKAAVLASVVNRFLDELIMACERGEEKPRHWADVGLVGYAADGGPAVGPAWGRADWHRPGLIGRDLVGIPDVYDHPLDIVRRTETEFHDDGAGGLTEVPVEVVRVVWYRPPPPADEVGRALLRAALARPADLTPWLVYADWLDDRDDPRAGVIRRELGAGGAGPGPAVERLCDWLTPSWEAAPAEPYPADTPMAAGLGRAADLLTDWIAAHPDSPPPVVIHLTGGGPVGTDAEAAADRLKRLATTDGNVLLLNVYLAASDAEPVFLPTGEWRPPDQPGQDLFWLSSRVPDPLRRLGEHRGVSAPPGSRLMAFNADPVPVLRLCSLGCSGPWPFLPRHLR